MPFPTTEYRFRFPVHASLLGTDEHGEQPIFGWVIQVNSHPTLRLRILSDEPRPYELSPLDSPLNMIEIPGAFHHKYIDVLSDIYKRKRHSYRLVCCS